ncbi:DUF599 domain-containing protein [Methylibium sp.]|uniref:DUF599 domain-containing protein n=1 Tax=Methylibium sp. TaxID=2067992 RepID=UPI00182BCEF5|nr:DUF599 domain-containing protein [Methylibium sp.]MBA3591445.1 DUF599 domain-containing protein [Methylibium sp.]
MNPLLPWLAIAAATLLIGAYELHLVMTARRGPEVTARSAHSRLRGEWVAALAVQPGSEILAVQTLRNSLMSATITASTAALALMGSVSLAASSAVRNGTLWAPPQNSARLVLELLLLATLFASYLCSAMAMRYFSQAGFVLSLPVGSPARERRNPMATAYVQRASVLYSWGLRLFLFVAPIGAGLVNPIAMPFAALALIVVLRVFDRAPDVPVPGQAPAPQ